MSSECSEKEGNTNYYDICEPPNNYAKVPSDLVYDEFRGTKLWIYNYELPLFQS
jgi:hypothetical protein